MKYVVCSMNFEFPSVTLEVTGLPSSPVFLSLYFNEARNYEEIMDELLSDPLNLKLLSEKRHPLQILDLLFSCNFIGDDTWKTKELYEFIKDHLLYILEDEVFKSTMSYLPRHEKAKSLLPFPYDLDERMAFPVYVLNELLGVKTYFSCQGVQFFVVVKGRKVYIPDGHNPFAYMIIENNQFVHDELIPYLKRFVDLNVEVNGNDDRLWIGTKVIRDNLSFVTALHDFSLSWYNRLNGGKRKCTVKGNTSLREALVG